MKKSLSVVVSLALVCQPLLARGKTVKKSFFQPHPQAKQDTVDETFKHSDKGFLIWAWDGSLYIVASLLYWEGDDRTVSLVLEIQNPTSERITLGGPKPPQQLFVPSTIVVLLPNGHSYRPYNQADVLQQAYAIEKDRLAKSFSEYKPPPVTTYNTNCSLTSNAAYCQTTADQSEQVGYALGFALGTAIRSAFVRDKADKYIKQIKESYLVSQQVLLGATVTGYVDLYVEDVHSGPFTVRIPAGDKTYDFVFGPEVSTVELPVEK